MLYTKKKQAVGYNGIKSAWFVFNTTKYFLQMDGLEMVNLKSISLKRILGFTTCLVLIFAFIFLIIHICGNGDAPYIEAYIINNNYYEVTTDNSILKEHKLHNKINSDMVGDLICSIVCNDGSKGDVYKFAGYQGSSVLILESNNEYRFMLYCNPENEAVNFNELLYIYGISDYNDIQLSVDYKDVGSKINTEKLIEALVKSNSVWSSDFYENSNISEATLEKTITVIISGSNTDILKFTYYPNAGLIEKACTIFELNSEADLLLKKVT